MPVAYARSQAVALRSWDAGEATVTADAVGGDFVLRAGSRALLALAAASQEPLVFASRADTERRLDGTVRFWQRWVGAIAYTGPWGEAVARSALALKLLVHAPSGAVAAAPTTSLPEVIGGERNWDYRYCWIRDTVFTLDALLQLGFHDEAHAFFWWFMHATRLVHPRLKVLYRLDGGAHVPERSLELAGYRGSRPVRMGNAAADQQQLDLYGDLFHTCWLYVTKGYPIDGDTGRELARDRGLRLRSLAGTGSRHLGGADGARSTSPTRRRCAGWRWTARSPWPSWARCRGTPGPLAPGGSRDQDVRRDMRLV